jgi:enoyl-CoA hydratase/carnithine racemase
MEGCLALDGHVITVTSWAHTIRHSTANYKYGVQPIMSTNLTKWETVDVRRRNSVTELRFHTDGGPLVWSATAHREQYEAFSWLSRDRETKVVIITGTAEIYCGELDVTSFAGMPWEDIWWEGRHLLMSLNDIDIPIISAINGPATIHAEIPVMADIVLAAPTVEFADRAHFALRDTVPGDGVNLIWGELLGPTRSKYFLITGSSIDADESLRLGVVNEIVAADDLLPRAWTLAEELCQRSLPVLRYTKSVLTVGFREHFSDRLSHSLGVEGIGHWSRGGIQPGHFTTSGRPDRKTERL